MLCQNCNKNNASVHYKSSINGTYVEKYLCRECAQKLGINVESSFKPIEMIDGFFGKDSGDIFGGLFAGMMTSKNDAQILSPKVCTSCGMRFSDFMHGGKIGCCDCYKTFYEALSPTIKRIHGSAKHCGKVPEGVCEKQSNIMKIEELRDKLTRAVEGQEYEMAAKYRDMIRELEKGEGEE